MPLVPDGRTVLTKPEALNGCNSSIRGHAGHLPPFIPVTNAHRERSTARLRKAIKTSGHFPDEQAATKLIYLAILRAERKWRHAFNWTAALRGLKIHFGNRLPD